MSKVNEILEAMSSLTLLEAAELKKLIEDMRTQQTMRSAIRGAAR